MADITVADLLSWEPRIRLDDPSGYYSTSHARESYLDFEVSWAVTLRASMPVLPQIRGGEIVIMPSRILAESGVGTDEIVREVHARGALGVVVDSLVDIPPPLVPLWADTIAADLESDINRLLTEQRGQIYQRGTDLGRVLAQASANGAQVNEIVRLVAEFMGIEAGIVNPREGVMAASAGSIFDLLEATEASWPSRGWVQETYVSRLMRGSYCCIGPVPAEQRALVRIVAERVVLAVETALSYADDMRPRGNARSVALSGLLMESPVEASRIAAALGLPSNGMYQVLLANPERDRMRLQRDWIGGGTVQDAIEVDGLPAMLIEYPAGSGTGHHRASASTTRFRQAQEEGWTTQSEILPGASSIPLAAGQARYLAALVQSGLLPARDLQFDTPADTGVYRLLFPIWGSGELVAFANDMLGALIAGDRRGMLQETLLAFLESGGSQVDAARLLGVHRNTLAYRLRQIRELTGINPIDTEDRLALHMALIASKLPPASRAQ